MYYVRWYDALMRLSYEIPPLTKCDGNFTQLNMNKRPKMLTHIMRSQNSVNRSVCLSHVHHVSVVDLIVGHVGVPRDIGNVYILMTRFVYSTHRYYLDTYAYLNQMQH